MMKSPYAGKPEASWLAITKQLVASHPLSVCELLDSALGAWQTLWHSSIGTGQTSVRLATLKVPATIVGYFFEILLARELERRHPGLWRGTQTGDEKDLVYIPDASRSVEIKASGQAGFRVYGNRSYGQKPEGALLTKKEKSGFYLTANFYLQTLTLLRFGWIDADDWVPQKAPTGQMAGLKQPAYNYKLIPIAGAYRQRAPLILLRGLGPTIVEECSRLGMQTIGDLLAFTGELPPRLSRVKNLNSEFLAGCYDQL